MVTGKGFALARMSNGICNGIIKIFLSLNLRLYLIDLRLPPPDFVSPREREGVFHYNYNEPPAGHGGTNLHLCVFRSWLGALWCAFRLAFMQSYLRKKAAFVSTHRAKKTRFLLLFCSMYSSPRPPPTPQAPTLTFNRITTGDGDGPEKLEAGESGSSGRRRRPVQSKRKLLVTLEIACQTPPILSSSEFSILGIRLATWQWHP